MISTCQMNTMVNSDTAIPYQSQIKLFSGENVLHIAIVNEDPGMVKFLLGSGVNFQERCFGNFMCPEDQKSSRTDSLTHEWVNVCLETNYEG